MYFDQQLDLAVQTNRNQIWYQLIATNHFSLQSTVLTPQTNGEHFDGRVCLPRFDLFCSD